MMPQTVKCKRISFSYKFYRICEMALCTKCKYEFKNNYSIFIITNHKKKQNIATIVREQQAASPNSDRWQFCQLTKFKESYQTLFKTKYHS